jgi:hypothetical protein
MRQRKRFRIHPYCRIILRNTTGRALAWVASFPVCQSTTDRAESETEPGAAVVMHLMGGDETPISKQLRDITSSSHVITCRALLKSLKPEL